MWDLNGRLHRLRRVSEKQLDRINPIFKGPRRSDPPCPKKSAREWSRRDASDIDGRAGRPRERERASQLGFRKSVDANSRTSRRWSPQIYADYQRITLDRVSPIFAKPELKIISKRGSLRRALVPPNSVNSVQKISTRALGL